MTRLPSRIFTTAYRALLAAFVGGIFAAAALGQAQSTAADLSGTVTDPNGAVVAGASVTAKSLTTGAKRTVTSSSDGAYQFIGLPADDYEITAEASTFKKSVISPVKLTVGQSADLTVKLEIGAPDAIVTVSGDDAQLIETTKTTVSTTIDQARIENLPINERSATGFALTISTVGRDNGRPVGPAPTSGLNIGGQRGRSTLVQVDGADFTDNSINAARSTVSQEAVQEFQVTTNSYMPEFGRATGGIINVVTKRGGNEYHGNLFGFIRDKSIQSRNAFAPLIDNDPTKKPGYTRTQYGGTFGGPIAKDRSFIFISAERRVRHESGFFTGDIIGGATSSVTIGSPFLPLAQTFTGLTSDQASFVQKLLTPTDPAFNPSIAIAYAHMASIGTQTALNGSSSLINFLPGIGVAQGSVVGSRFLLSGAPIPLTRDANGQYVAFRPLNQLQKVFPIHEGSIFSSVRFDEAFTPKHQFSLRLGYNPSTLTGIQDESQNQTLGQNDYSRTGIQTLKDISVGMSLTSILPRNMVNEAYFNFGRRDAKFDSAVPSVADQITGSVFTGSNPFSPVARRENRVQFRDNITWAHNDHLFKAGVDLGTVSGNARFDLNFPGLFNFGAQSCSSLITGCNGPSFTPIQTYGLGFPSVFLQGFGDPYSSLANKPLAFFIQDTWKVNKHLSLNYGVRYDLELTKEYGTSSFQDPLTGITLSAQDMQVAQDALNVTQGFPTDKNNIAPRFGFAYDMKGDGRTVIRGAYGMFYDHPLLAVAFNSNIADGSQQQQSTLLPFGGPSPTGLLNAFQVFQGTIRVCNFAGAIPGTNCTLGLASTANYLQGYQRFDSSRFTGFGPVLPFTLNVAKDFQYPVAYQGNLGIEKMIGKDMSLSASFITVNARHLGHPQDVNQVDNGALNENFRRFAGRAPTSLTEASFFFISNFACSSPTTCANPNPAAFTYLIPNILVVNNVTGQKFINPIAANYFRKLGPNYFYTAMATQGLVTKAILDSALAGTVAHAGPLNAYADVNAQLSDGNSSYNAVNIELKKRFSSNIQFFATYTWSHSIDDSSDLQTLLKPQDNNNFRAERANSLFDQRHRFVFSGMFSAPDSWRSGSLAKKIVHGFVLSPIFEYGSGRPFNIIAPGDANGDFQSTNERPSVRADGSLCQTSVDADCQTNVFPSDGTLGRNMGITHNYISLDARLSRKIRFNERFSLDLIAEGFNLFNRFNEAASNPFYTAVNAYGQKSGGGKYYSAATASFDPRQFQFGVKLNF